MLPGPGRVEDVAAGDADDGAAPGLRGTGGARSTTRSAAAGSLTSSRRCVGVNRWGAGGVVWGVGESPSRVAERSSVMPIDDEERKKRMRERAKERRKNPEYKKQEQEQDRKRDKARRQKPGYVQNRWKQEQKKRQQNPEYEEQRLSQKREQGRRRRRREEAREEGALPVVVALEVYGDYQQRLKGYPEYPPQGTLVVVNGETLGKPEGAVVVVRLDMPGAGGGCRFGWGGG